MRELETNVPTRADIAKILNATKPKKGNKAEKKIRNKARSDAVKAKHPVVFDYIQSDLESYAEWEKEVDD